jgi:hypothetical protein
MAAKQSHSKAKKMAAKPIRKLVVKTSEYIDNVTGRNKARWLQVGIMFKHDDGNFSIKLEALPIAKDFDGWISLFPIDDQKPQEPQQPAPQRQAAAPRQPAQQAYAGSQAYQAPQTEDDNIPF